MNNDALYTIFNYTNNRMVYLIIKP